MATPDRVGTTATTIHRDGGYTIVVYQSTPVVQFNDKEVILDSGGWRTATTKTRMNQASKEFDLGYYVNQRGGEWHVRDKTGKEKLFTDGMRLKR